jgi:transposase
LLKELPVADGQLHRHHKVYRLNQQRTLLSWSPVMNDRRSKTYRPWNPHHYRQQAHTPAAKLPEGDLVFFLLDVVPQLDLSPIYAPYEDETRGAPPFDPAMMVCLLLYAYCVGVYSSRKIALACERNLAFLAIVGDDRPDFRTISDFRKLHLTAFAHLFVVVLRLAKEAGLVQLGTLTTDGTKLPGNASRHKAMSYGYLEKEVERLRAEIDALLRHAQEQDAADDAVLGSRRGDELPAELQRREDRLATIVAAKQRLEEQARAAAEAERQRRQEAEAERQRTDAPRRGRAPAPVDETPDAKAQTNFTDPELKIMKTNNKGWDYCANAQMVVDDVCQIIVACDVTTATNDKEQAVPMAQAALATLEQAGMTRPTDAEGQSLPLPYLTDSGYYSEKAAAGLAALGLDPYMATERQRHHAAANAAASPPTAKAAMAAKLRTPVGRALYALRKAIVEPVFGQIKGARGFRRFRLRGLEKIRGEWRLVCLTHNLLKIWRYGRAAIGN